MPVRELVPGDVVLLEAGDAVPADCRVIEAHELAVNNAALTGESEPVGRTTDPVAGGTPLLQARNCVFMGTVVAAGAGKALVLATGAATEFGRIFRLAGEAPQQRMPLQRQVAAMARRVGAVALVIGAVVFAVRVPSGQPLVETFVFALGVMVVLVPEGLPATLSVSLAIGVRRMARRHALVKRLLAVEALGSTTVICTIPGILCGQTAQLHFDRGVTGLTQRADHPRHGKQHRTRDTAKRSEPAELHRAVSPPRAGPRHGLPPPAPGLSCPPRTRRSPVADPRMAALPGPTGGTRSRAPEGMRGGTP